MFYKSFLSTCACFLISSQIICFAFINKQANPSQIDYFAESIKLYERKDLENTVLYLNNALALNPNDLLTLVELAEVFVELSKYDLAISTLQQAIKLAPEDALLHVLLAKVYITKNQLNEASLEFELASKLEPGNVLLKAHTGLVCSLQSNYQCAIENFGKVILAYPFQLRSRAVLGKVYHLTKDYNLAKEQYKRILKYEPKNSYIWYNLAKAELAFGDYEDAKESITKAILLDSSVTDFYLDRAFINYKLNKLEDSEGDYLAALKLDPINPIVSAEYGTFLWKTGAYLKSEEQFAQALSLEPDNKDFKVYIAYLLQLAKQHDDAMNAWKALLKEDDQNKCALFNLAKLYQELEDYSSAIELLKKLLALEEGQNKNTLETKLTLAYCLQKKQDFGEAEVIYNSILEVDPSSSIALFNLALLLNEKKEYKEAITFFNKAIENKFSPLNEAYKGLVHAYTSLNDSVGLKDVYKNWLNIDIKNIEARLAYAEFLSKSGEPQAATEQYRVAAALDSTPKTRYLLAQFLLEQKDLYGGIAQLQEYLKTLPNDLNALILLASAYKDLGIPEEAISNYKKIIAIQYDNHLAYYNLGLLYQSDGKHEEAENFLLKAIELNEKYSPAYYALGLSYMVNNNADKAKGLFQKYLELDPNGEYRDKAEAKLKELAQGIAVNNPE